MTRDDIKPAQAAAIGETVGPMLGYLIRLLRRMEKVGFPPNDPLFQCVKKAWDAVYSLSVDLHYLSCAGGVLMTLEQGDFAIMYANEGDARRLEEFVNNHLPSDRAFPRASARLAQFKAAETVNSVQILSE